MGIKQVTGSTDESESKVRELPDKYAECKREVVEGLEELLARAKKGELVEIEVAARMGNGLVLNHCSGAKDDVYRMAGILFDRAVGYRNEHIEH